MGQRGRTSWEQWLAEESAELTNGAGPIGKDTSRLRAPPVPLHRHAGGRAAAHLPLPAGAAIKCALCWVNSTRTLEAAIEMRALLTCRQRQRTSTLTKCSINGVKTIEANEARRLSAAQQTVLKSFAAHHKLIGLTYKPDAGAGIRDAGDSRS